MCVVADLDDEYITKTDDSWKLYELPL
jgi:hypothetical protein